SRLSLQTIDPRTYFPIIESDVIPGGSYDRVVGQMIAEDILGDDGKTHFIKMQRWLKASHPDHEDFGKTPPPEGFDIEFESVRLDLAGWDDESKRRLMQTYVAKGPLPGIKQLPIYHIK